MLKRLSIAICISSIIVSLCNFFYNSGGEFLLRIGEIIAMFIQVFWLLYSSDDGYWLVIPTLGITALNIFVYAVGSFLLLTILNKTRETRI